MAHRGAVVLVTRRGSKPRNIPANMLPAFEKRGYTQAVAKPAPAPVEAKQVKAKKEKPTIEPENVENNVGSEE